MPVGVSLKVRLILNINRNVEHVSENNKINVKREVF